jgi:hypothetical protein
MGKEIRTLPSSSIILYCCFKTDSYFFVLCASFFRNLRMPSYPNCVDKYCIHKNRGSETATPVFRLPTSVFPPTLQSLGIQ